MYYRSNSICDSANCIHHYIRSSRNGIHRVLLIFLKCHHAPKKNFRPNWKKEDQICSLPLLAREVFSLQRSKVSTLRSMYGWSNWLFCPSNFSFRNNQTFYHNNNLVNDSNYLRFLFNFWKSRKVTTCQDL